MTESRACMEKAENVFEVSNDGLERSRRYRRIKDLLNLQGQT